jgi:predicted nucleic acid-binding protein
VNRPVPVSELLVDTDVFVDHLRGAHRLVEQDLRIHYSAITRAELFAGPEHQLDAVRTLLGPFTQHPVDAGVAELGGRLRRVAGIPLPDALIAATALAGDLALVTRNRRHFDRVDGLILQAL